MQFDLRIPENSLLTSSITYAIELRYHTRVNEDHSINFIYIDQKLGFARTHKSPATKNCTNEQSRIMGFHKCLLNPNSAMEERHSEELRS